MENVYIDRKEQVERITSIEKTCFICYESLNKLVDLTVQLIPCLHFIWYDLHTKFLVLYVWNNGGIKEGQSVHSVFN
jgi:hypothetical protein